jgi:hypothetical protein
MIEVPERGAPIIKIGEMDDNVFMDSTIERSLRI